MGKYKPIRRLGHQFGSLLLEPKLTSEEIAEALRQAELLEYGLALDAKGLPTHYRETMPAKLAAPAFRELVTHALMRYCKACGYDYEVNEEVKQTNPTDHYDPNDFGV